MLSCYIIGGSTLAIKLGAILLQNNFLIRGIFSENQQTRNYFESNGIKTLTDLDSFYTLLLSSDYDYLFSAVNPRIQPIEIINAAKVASINYHDSLLPAYAGCNATSWAILHNEARHGVTWHVMDAKIDHGPILIQKDFPILATDTALDLNLKAYQAAINTFAYLVPLLPDSGDILGIIPDNENLHSTTRSYYAKNTIPTHRCILDWNWCTSKMSTIFRACNYGPYSNPFTPFKLEYDSKIYVIKDLKILPTSSNYIAGTILKNTDRRIFATNDNDISLLLEEL